MAISLYFGLPGCGKTTLLTKFALDGVRDPKYKNVYSNVALAVPGVTIIDNDCIGRYELENCLLLIDEATLFADSRNYKEFDKGKLQYFLMHRHRCADIILFTQQFDAYDKRIRTITDRVYYVYKGWLLGHWFSSYWRVPYGILFPDPKKTGEKLGEIVQGYSKPHFIVRLFAKRIYRPRYYKYFDSWELERLPDLPAEYVSNPVPDCDSYVLRAWIRDNKKLLRRTRKQRKGFTHAENKVRKVMFTGKLFRPNPLQRLRKLGKYCTRT